MCLSVSLENSRGEAGRAKEEGVRKETFAGGGKKKKTRRRKVQEERGR